MYKELDQENKAFTLIHCWNKLKNEDKWKTKRREMADQDKRPKIRSRRCMYSPLQCNRLKHKKMTIHLCKHKQKVDLYNKKEKRGRPVRRRQKKLLSEEVVRLACKL